MPSQSNHGKIIKNGQIRQDSWQLVILSEAGDCQLPSAGDIIVPLTIWQQQSENLSKHPGKVGVWLNSDEAPEILADQLQELPLIAINFPAFTDGRGYSYARLLRERFHYQGEIRAIGDVLQDQIYYMRRCGFDTFAIREDKDIDSALLSLTSIKHSYQAAIDQPQPLFRRR